MFGWLDPWIARYEALRETWGSAVDVFLVVLLVVAFNMLLRLAVLALGKYVEKTTNIWDDAVFNSLSAPGRAMAWAVGLYIAVDIADPPAESLLAEYSEPVWTVVLVAIITWFLFKVVEEFKHGYMRRAVMRGDEVDQTLLDAISKLLRASLAITAVLIVLESLGVSISGLLAFGGVGGIAVGFAAKDILANVFGGLTIYLNRPFSVGDWIRSPDRDIEGVVEKIGWRFVSLRRFDKRPLYVPNAVFTNVSLENPSRMTHRRIFENIGLRYDDAARVAPVLGEIRQMLEDDEEIDSNEIILVHFNQFGAHSLDFFIFCYTVTTQWARYHEVKQAVLLRVHQIIDAHGAEVAYPTTTLRAPDGLALIEHAGGPARNDSGHLEAENESGKTAT